MRCGTWLNTSTGRSTEKELIEIAQKYDIAVLAGILEKENEKIYKAYVCVDKNGSACQVQKVASLH
jgi:predicted amidohydrolase